jgi:hypothetical protein
MKMEKSLRMLEHLTAPERQEVAYNAFIDMVLADALEAYGEEKGKPADWLAGGYILGLAAAHLNEEGVPEVVRQHLDADKW